MARRRQSEDIEFGSDSFLDIVANIVGILIILIVIAGVRVSQTPVTVAKPASAETVDNVAPKPPPSRLPDDLPPAETLPALPLPIEVAELPGPPEPREEPEPIDRPPIPEPPPLSLALVGQAATRQQEVDRLKQRLVELAAEEEALTDEQKALRQKLDEASRDSENERPLVARGRLAVLAQEELLKAKQHELATLQRTLVEAEAEQPPPTVLKHKLTPVGRTVDGEELHFLLSGGRVAVVPMEEMAEELKRHLRRKRDQVLRTNRYVGTMGPVQGFRMTYVVERQPTSLIEELRMGAAIIRSGLTEFQIHPEPGVITEAAAQALHPRGRFLAALRRAGPDATLTFWVYPDSFALHRTLQEFAHDHGFEVAARPLPTGVPISGSPQGSRSVAQ